MSAETIFVTSETCITSSRAATRKAGVKVASVDELVEKLKSEAGVI